ncbi:MAG: EVE domain-containing protein [Myxococcaceae bacterium]
MAVPAHWLVKSEPSAYGWEQLVRDGRTEWTGIRNFEARNNLRKMQVGDLVLYYHSTEEKQVVGVARVTRAAVPDPTAPGEDWASVELAPVERLATPVPLERLRKDARLRTFQLLTRSRLSVVPATPSQFRRVLELGKTQRGHRP